MSNVTRILSAIENGDPQAAEQLLPLVYDELRQLAAQKLARERPGQTLDQSGLHKGPAGHAEHVATGCSFRLGSAPRGIADASPIPRTSGWGWPLRLGVASYGRPIPGTFVS